MEKRLRISGIFIIAGLVTQLSTLIWSHPTAFLAFILIGGLLLTIGILFYLYSLVAVGNG